MNWFVLAWVIPTVVLDLAIVVLVVMFLGGCAAQANVRFSCEGDMVKCELQLYREGETVL